jgi:hypothetical protein
VANQPIPDKTDASFPRLPDHNLTVAAMVLLWSYVVIGAAHIANHFAGYPYRKHIFLGESYRTMPYNIPITAFLGIFGVATIVVFLCWINGAFRNLTLLRVQAVRNTPTRAVLSFLIPFYNLVAPYLVMQELYRASAPRAPGDSRYEWQDGRGSRLVACWWLFCILALLPVLAPTPPYDELATGEFLSPVAWWEFTFLVLWSKGAMMLAAGFGALSIRLIRKRQLERFTQMADELDYGLNIIHLDGDNR